MKKVLFACICILSSFSALSQKGVVKGNVVDASTGEELIGVTVVLKGTTQGAVTDFSGNYYFELNEGTYNLQYSYISYQTQTVEGLVVNNGEVKTLNISMQEDNVQLEEVVVQAEAINNNEVALLKLQKKAYAVQDGISAAEIGRLGASNSAESMKQVTGATIEDGKYVVMRGLGDRYSITQMNGVTLPSTDPYRNSSSMDLIPTAMIENIVTKKTFTPDQPGNFTGGNVDITTRPLPDEFYLQAGVQIGINSQSSFNNEFLTDPISGGNDWLGFDDGSRAIDPLLLDPDVLEFLKGAAYIRGRRTEEQYEFERNAFNDAAKILNQPVFVPETKQAGPNTRFSLGFGDRKPLGKGNIGYNAGLTFNRNFTHLESRQFNLWEYTSSPNATSLNNKITTSGDQSLESSTLSGLFGLAYKFNDYNEISGNYIYNHDGEFNALSLTGFWPGAISNAHTFETRLIRFVERELQNLSLSGNHVLRGFRNTEIHWTGGRIVSTQDEPDVRIFANDIQNSGYVITKAEYDEPFHFWRELEDVQYNGKIDIDIPLNNSNKLKFGGLFSDMDREFGERRFQQSIVGTNNIDQYTSFTEANGDFDTFFDPANAGNLDTLAASNRYYTGNWYQNLTNDKNFYNGSSRVIAGYAMVIYNLNKKLKFIGGARVEKTDIEVITRFKDSQGQPTSIVGLIDDLDVLPSINFIYALNDQSNLRLSGSQTLARPNMREMAPFATPDLFSGLIVKGNPELTKSQIWNFDLRYEIFPKSGELLAVSAFYKSFENPINRIYTPVGSGAEVTWVNVNDAFLGGIELEYRKGLEFIAPALANFKLGTNFTYTYSRVDLSEEEFESNSNVNPDQKSYRPFQAQSPFIWNLNLTYLNFENGIESAISMNMFGRRLNDNGVAGAPDIYEIYGKDNKPAPLLNFTFAKTFGEHFTTTLKVTNILNANMETNQEFNDQYFVNNQFNRGVTYSVGLRYRY